MLLLLVWLAGDILLFLGSYALAYFLRVGLLVSTDFPLTPYLQTVMIVTPLWLGVLISLRTFALTRIQTSLRNILYLLYGAVMGMALFSLTFYFWQGTFFSRLMLVYAGTISFIGTLLWHMIFDQWQRRVLRKNKPAYPLLIVGVNREAERMIKLLNEKQSVFKPVAVLDSRGVSQTDVAGVPVVGKLNKLEQTLKDYRISHLMQCSDLEHSLNLVSVCRQHGITYLLLPSVLGILQGDETMESIEGQPVTMVTPGKRLFGFFS